MRNIVNFFALFSAGILLSGCTAPAFQTGPDAEVSFDGLTRVDHTTMDEVWAKTDIDLSGYSKILLVDTDIQYRPVKERAGSRLRTNLSSGDMDFPISELQKARLREIVITEFVKELEKSEKFELVSTNGPDVLIIKGTLIDVASSVPPPTLGRSDIYLSEVGEATLVLELYDGESGAILARAKDKRAAESMQDFMRADSVNTWAEVRRLAGSWARLLRRSLDSLATEGMGKT